MKHMPAVSSVSVTPVSSEERAVDPDPAKTMPKPKIRALRTIRMSKFVRFRVNTSEVEVALAKASMATGISGATIVL